MAAGEHPTLDRAFANVYNLLATVSASEPLGTIERVFVHARTRRRSRPNCARNRSALPFRVMTLGAPGDGGSIPAFMPDGLLPLGPQVGVHQGQAVYQGHDCALAEIEARFADSWSESETRPHLVRELRMLTRVAADLTPCFTMLVSGAFVTRDEDPTGIYVGLVVREVDEAAPAFKNWLMRRVFDGKEWDLPHGNAKVETGLALRYDVDDPRFDFGHTDEMLLRLLATEPTPDAPAGYVEFEHCPKGVTFDAEIEGEPGIGVAPSN